MFCWDKKYNLCSFLTFNVWNYTANIVSYGHNLRLIENCIKEFSLKGEVSKLISFIGFFPFVQDFYCCIVYINNIKLWNRKKLFAHSKINNNKVECAHLLLSATQRMISWLINSIIYLHVHIICYLPQVVHLSSIFPPKIIIQFFRGQIDNNLHTQIILFILRGQIANKVHHLGQIANNLHPQVAVGK